MYPTNCPNCAAPLHNGKCKYCDTEVVGEINFDDYIEFNLTGHDYHGNKYVLPVCGRISNISMSNDYIDAMDCTGRVIKSFINQRNIEFTFNGAVRKT